MNTETDFERDDPHSSFCAKTYSKVYLESVWALLIQVQSSEVFESCKMYTFVAWCFFT